MLVIWVQFPFSKNVFPFREGESITGKPVVWNPSATRERREYMAKNKKDFIMLPTVDFCFKELMQNPTVRKGFIAALLKIPPKKIRRTTLQPTILDKRSKDDKVGILDVCVIMTDGTTIDMEMQVAPFEYWEKRVLFYLGKMYVRQIREGESYEKLKKCIHVSVLNFEHIPDDKCYHTINLRDEETGKLYTDLFELKILELPKLPKVSELSKHDEFSMPDKLSETPKILMSRECLELSEDSKIGRLAKFPAEMKEDEGVLRWMRFFSGKRKEDFEDMAKGNRYLDEAYQTLLELSADEKKRLEYEAREKALRDYNSQMQSARKQGWKQGQEQGQEQVSHLIRKLLEAGRNEEALRVVSDSEYRKELMKELGV